MKRRTLLLSAAGAAAWGEKAGLRTVVLQRARLLSEFPSEQVAPADGAVMKQAEKIAEGTVFFYDRTPVEIGLKQIDWSGGQIHHQEWPAQLNRFYYLGPLASAYKATGDERFAKAARAYIEDWIRGDPYEHATTLRAGDNTLNMSIRLGSSVHAGWTGVLWVFLGSPSFDDAFLDRMLASISHQAEFLSHHLTAVGNWRISQLDALVFTALRFPFLENAGRLQELAIPGMEAALAGQFLPDGAHIERTPSYAGWMTQVAANYCRLAQIFPGADAHVDVKRLLASLDYGAQCDLSGINDAIGPLSDPKVLAGLEQRRRVMAWLKLQAPETPPLCQTFANAGQIYMRSAWRPGADYIAFDASSWGGGHCHLSRLGFAFRSGGRMMVADPGILTYEMSDPMGPYGKSTAAHSTLNLGGRNQSGADAELLRTEFSGDIKLIHARYQGGYWEGDYGWNFRRGRGAGIYGSHERLLLWINGEYLLALDAMDADEGADIRNCWQMGPAERWSQDAARLTWWSENRDRNVLLDLVAAPDGTVMEIFEGKKDPPRGWVGNHGDDWVAAPLVEYRYRGGKTPSVTVALVAAYSGANRPRFAAKAAVNGVIRQLEIELPGGSKDVIRWSVGLALAIDDGQPFATDGRLVWMRQDGAGRPMKWFTLDGRYLMYGGRRMEPHAS
ncbi:MAG: alginate lyase family protein [Bryobacterales bacterium]|nr:alginate lyase family protein [Bryobacterales bacterium]